MKQVLTYLRVTDVRLGLLLNFGAALMRDGIHRIVNGLEAHAETQRFRRPRISVRDLSTLIFLSAPLRLCVSFACRLYPSTSMLDPFLTDAACAAVVPS